MAGANADTPDLFAINRGLEGIDVPRTGVATRAGPATNAKTILL